jgi:hypothetical protein
MENTRSCRERLADDDQDNTRPDPIPPDGFGSQFQELPHLSRTYEAARRADLDGRRLDLHSRT